MSTRKPSLASQNRGQKGKNRGQKKPRRRQGGKGKPFQKGQPDLPGKRFEPGNNANPGGRPRSLKEVKERLQVRAVDLADRLLDIALSTRTEDKDAVHAIKESWDRAFGRSVQAVEISGPGGGAVETRTIDEMTSAERGRRVVQLFRKAGAKVVAPTTPSGEDGNGGAGGP